jgi:hypothetical protein
MAQEAVFGFFRPFDLFHLFRPLNPFCLFWALRLFNLFGFLRPFLFLKTRNVFGPLRALGLRRPFHALTRPESILLPIRLAGACGSQEIAASTAVAPSFPQQAGNTDRLWR